MMLPTFLAMALVAFVDSPTSLEIVEALENVTTDAIARAQPSVVAITRIRGEDPEKTTAIRGLVVDRGGFDPRAGLDGMLVPRTPGDYAPPGDFSAGVVVGKLGEILTTYHTLLGAERIWVRGGKQEFEAEIVAADPRSDLAMIAPRLFGNQPPPALSAIKMGDASKLKAGTFLISLGNSYNAGRDGRASAGFGILANTARKVHSPPLDGTPVRGQFFRYQPTLLQLDTKLNLGMSGGAVINMKGELVGITTAGASPVGYDAQAGYAIPMNDLGLRIVATLREGKEVEYGFLGVGLHGTIPNGISTVTKGTPADKADLVVNDVILALGDHELELEDGLTMALSNIPAGATVKLKVLRDGQVLEKSVLVSKYPVAGELIATNRPPSWRGLRVDFTSVLNADGQQNLMEAMAKGGVGITEVETGKPGDLAGLKKGMVITEVDGKPIQTPTDFVNATTAGSDRDVTLSTELGEFPGQKFVVKKPR